METAAWLSGDLPSRRDFCRKLLLVLTLCMAGKAIAEQKILPDTPPPHSVGCREKKPSAVVELPVSRLISVSTELCSVDDAASSLSAERDGETPTNNKAGDEDSNTEDSDDEDESDAPAKCDLLNRCLLGDCFSERTGITVSGFVAQGFSWNPASPADRFNGYLCQNDRANEYQLNQAQVAVGKDPDTQADDLSFGFHADALYGTDAFLFQNLGWDDHIVSEGGSRFYKLAFPQLYGAVFLPVGRGITAQLGKWYGLVGYESGLASDDFFYSHPLGYNLTPYTHTGLLLSFDIADGWSTSQGLQRGSDVWEDNNNALSYVGNLTWTSSDEKSSCCFAILVGPEQDERADWQDLDGVPGPDAPGESLNRVTYSLSAERQMTEKLRLAVNHDYFYQDGSATWGIGEAEAYGVTGYAFYRLSDTLTLGVRAEVFRDDDGFVSSGFRSGNAAAPGLYTDLTIGLNIDAGPCVRWRPELRWDWQDRDDRSDIPAFDSGTSTGQFLLALDAVVQF